MNSDRLTKQIVICTLCLLATLAVGTACNLAFRQLPIPVEVKDLATYIIGVLSGMLIKTGVDSVSGQLESPAPDGNEAEAQAEDEEGKSKPKTDPLSKGYQRNTAN